MDKTLTLHYLSFLIILLMRTCSAKYPFQDPTLSWDKRTDDLVGRLTLEEIAAFTEVHDRHMPPSAKRLGIYPYRISQECLRGVLEPNSTVWPQAIGVAATFR